MENDDYKTLLSLLRQLQERQSEIQRLGHLITELPEKIRTLEEEIKADEEALEKAENDLKNENLKNTRMDGDLKLNQEQLSQKNLQTFNVKSNEQLWALQKEMKFLEEKISTLETHIIESLEALDQYEENRNEARKLLKQRKSENTKKITELNKDLEQMKTELIVAQKGQEDILSQIPNKYIQLMDMILARKGGSAVAEVKDGTCQACHFRIRPQIFLELKMVKGIYQCDNCSRILFFKEDY